LQVGTFFTDKQIKTPNIPITTSTFSQNNFQ